MLLQVDSRTLKLESDGALSEAMCQKLEAIGSYQEASCTKELCWTTCIYLQFIFYICCFQAFVFKKNYSEPLQLEKVRSPRDALHALGYWPALRISDIFKNLQNERHSLYRTV